MNTEVGGVGPWSIEELHITAGTGTVAAAAVRMSNVDGTVVDEAAVGDGPIDAAFSALDRATQSNLTLKNFDVRSVTDGEDAQGEVTVTVSHGDASFRGHGISTDIVEAGALAYLDVINRISRRDGASVVGDTSRTSHAGV